MGQRLLPRSLGEDSRGLAFGPASENSIDRLSIGLDDACMRPVTRDLEGDRLKVYLLWLPVILVANVTGGSFIVANLQQAPASAAFAGLFLVLVDALAIYRWRAWASQRKGTRRANAVDPSSLQQLVGFSFMLCASLVIIIVGIARYEAGRVVGGLVPLVLCGWLVFRAVGLIRRGAPGATGDDDES